MCFNSFISIHSRRFIRFNSFMSFPSCQFFHFNSFMTIHSFQFMRFNSSVSIPSFQIILVNWFMSIHSFHACHFFSNHLHVTIICATCIDILICVCTCFCHYRIPWVQTIKWHPLSANDAAIHKAPAGSLDDATAVKVSQKILPRFGGLGLRGSQGPKQEHVLGLLTGKACCNVSRNAPHLQEIAKDGLQKHQVIAGWYISPFTAGD